MKILYTSLFILFVQAAGMAQEFKTSAEASQIYDATLYKGSTDCGVITSDGLLIHANDEVEVVNLNQGKTIYTFDFPGGAGQTWLDPKGRYVGNYSQNTERIDNRWVDAMQILDLDSKKLYTTNLKDGYWNKGVFHPQKSEVLVNVYNAVEGSARILLYDFVDQKEVKTFFTTTKFSTVIMALAFSADGSKVYAGIGPNGYVSYINVYDYATGNVLKKIDFKYSLDKIFVGDGYFYTSGYDGNSGAPFTSKINATSYAVEATWGFRMENLHPAGDFCFGVEFESGKLSQFDLKTGKKIDLFGVNELGKFEFAYASGFSPDGKYFFISRQRDREKPDYAKAIIVFKNLLMEEDVNIYEPIRDDKIVALPTAYNYKRDIPRFSIDFEAEPEVKEEQTNSGGLKLTLKQSPNKDVVYMVLVTAISPGIKESKYPRTSEDMAVKFVSNMEATIDARTTFSVDGHTGTDCTFSKGGTFYHYRAVCVAGFAFQLIYINSAGDGLTGEDFLNSFSTK